MSTRTLAMLSLLIGPVVIASCSEHTAPNASAPPATFGFTNGPAEPGNSGIFRFRDAFFATIADFDAGFIAIIGLQSTVAELCDDLGEFDLADFQIKPHQLGEVSSLITMRNATVQILPLPDEPQDFCGDLAGAPVLYSGTGSLQRTDNNFTATGTEGGRANSFGWTSQGQVTGASGLVNYNGVVRLLITPDDEFKEVVSRLRIG